jgi:hypothetical protein
MSVKTQFGEWRVNVEHPSGQCVTIVSDATLHSNRHEMSDRCSRTGHYGWGDKLYCYQHHPDWNQWLVEKRRLDAIADKAFRSAMREESR